jgi:hypothetical protein
MILAYGQVTCGTSTSSSRRAAGMSDLEPLVMIAGILRTRVWTVVVSLSCHGRVQSWVRTGVITSSRNSEGRSVLVRQGRRDRGGYRSDHR